MWIWLDATIKSDATAQQIKDLRREWIRQGKDRKVAERCGSAWRYVVEGQTPSQVFWLVETDDPSVIDIFREHFGGLWDLTVHKVTPEALG